MKWSLLALIIGFCVDLAVGDPRNIPHPVIFIGKLISLLDGALRRVFHKTEAGEKTAGAVLWCIVVLVCTLLPALVLWLCHMLSPWLRLAVESVMCWQILAAKSLRDESMKVYDALESGDIEKSRYAVSPAMSSISPMTSSGCAASQALFSGNSRCKSLTNWMRKLGFIFFSTFLTTKKIRVLKNF